ncbi:hypothetical protein F4808DRAFT_72187 [Astrocystis sublimbata]|nr:hypothetical protein F4808DRAFT_72187 [Astrocystis sublimbata]
MHFLLPLSLSAIFCVCAELPRFISPASHTQWMLGSIQTIEFTAPEWKSWRMDIWQNWKGGGGATPSLTSICRQTVGRQAPTRFNWTVQTYDLDYSDSPSFSFWLQDVHNGSARAISPAFNISSDGIPTSASSTETVSSVTVTVTATPPIPTCKTNGSKGLSVDAAAGLGVGAALGSLILVGIPAVLILKRKRSGTKLDEARQWPAPVSVDANQTNGFVSQTNTISTAPRELSIAPYRPPVELNS